MKMHEIMRGIPPGMIRFIKGDPKGRAKSEKDFRSIFDYYAEYDIYFTPGINKIEDGILKVYGYFEAGRIKVHANLKNFIKEGTSYKYPEQELDKNKNAGEKPIDKDNHLMDCLRYIVAELPDNPDDLINEAYFPADTYGTIGSGQSHLPHALQDNDYDESPMDWISYY